MSRHNSFSRIAGIEVNLPNMGLLIDQLLMMHKRKKRKIHLSRNQRRSRSGPALTEAAIDPPVQFRPNLGRESPSTALAYDSGSSRTAGVTTASAPSDLSSSTVSSPGGLIPTRKVAGRCDGKHRPTFMERELRRGCNIAHTR